MSTTQPRRNVLTTGEVARICHVAPRTVSKWFDSGQLRGYRIPGSKDRRIPLDQLVRFMRAHNMPFNGLDVGQRRVLVVDPDIALGDALLKALTAAGEYEVRAAQNSLEAGAAAQELKPDVAVIDASFADTQPRAIARFFRSSSEFSHVLLIATGKGLTAAAGHALLQEGFDAYLAKPFETRALIELIEKHAGGSSVPEE
jgi:excisionase family DNA binding protein